jgi:hypothetical protein
VLSGYDELLIEKMTRVSKLLDEIEELEAEVAHIKGLRAAGVRQPCEGADTMTSFAELRGAGQERPLKTFGAMYADR